MQLFKEHSDVYSLLSEAIWEGSIIVNQAHEIVEINNKALKYFGYSKSELLGKALLMLIPERFRTIHKEHVVKYYDKVRAGLMADGKCLYGRKKNGEEFPLKVDLHPFSIFDNLYVLVLVHDMTEINEKEAKISELNSNLEKKIKKRTLELRDTVAQLTKEVKRRKEAEAQIKRALEKEQELNELKTKFLSMVSHEFKTPLSGILTSATLVGKYKESGHQKKRQKHLETITREVMHLNTILNDFLSIERLEKGKQEYNFKQFSLSKVVNEVVYNANMILKSGQKIKYPKDIDDIYIIQDERILMLSLSNLLYNAVKYSPENSEIDIEVKLDKKQVKFKIADQGIGIPRKDQKHIFERYFRAENVLLTQGTGIGLNIVKTHVENLGGTISFVSKENVGSTFTIELPLIMED
jgi:PAS domain S-box-containing protein